ncbi:uncharacterized protein ACR2FA_009136 [Aphomia sociella]
MFVSTKIQNYFCHASGPATPVSEKQEAEARDEPPPDKPTKRSPERPSTLQVEAAAAPAPAPALASAPAPAATTPECGGPVSPAGSTISRRDSQLTERGFFDVKFYHNKLW